MEMGRKTTSCSYFVGRSHTFDVVVSSATFSRVDFLPVAPLFEPASFLSTERALHQSEKVLEQVLEWSSLEFPSSAFLVIKKFPGARRSSDLKGAGCELWDAVFVEGANSRTFWPSVRRFTCACQVGTAQISEQLRFKSESDEMFSAVTFKSA